MTPHITLRNTTINFDASQELNDTSDKNLESIGTDAEEPVAVVAGRNLDGQTQPTPQLPRVGEKRRQAPLQRWSKNDTRMEGQSAEAVEVTALEPPAKNQLNLSSEANGDVKFAEFIFIELKKIKSDYFKFKVRQDIQESIFKYISMENQQNQGQINQQSQLSQGFGCPNSLSLGSYSQHI